MKANELMVGDWVGYLPTWENEDGSIGREGNPNNPIICKVEMPGSSGAQLYNGEDNFDADDIELYPIPLTPEILEKNGFEKREVRILAGSKTHYCIVDDYFELAINEYTDSIWEVEYTNIEAHFPLIRNLVCYVHELQHALRLCEIDKEIEL